mmetsp:Transcript_54815/g.117040  ORF Transcript_54815/g.117040 Transcript_54815/m.117040 type:complete len:420 (+) Transcript_54815:81-1340(+)
MGKSAPTGKRAGSGKQKNKPGKASAGKRKGGKAAGGGGGFKPGKDSTRSVTRREERLSQKNEKGQRQKRKHGGGEAIFERKQRMRAKVLERQVARLGKADKVERRKLLTELGLLQAGMSRLKEATQHFTAALEADRSDPDFAIRAPLLCLYLEQEMTEEAVKLIVGPLFKPLLQTAPLPEDPSSGSSTSSSSSLSFHAKGRRSLSATVGQWTRAMLKFIKVHVLEDHKSTPKNAEKEERELESFFQQAKAQNSFIAEFLSFYPAFERHFPLDAELPPLEETRLDNPERPLREALEYLIRYRQTDIWLETDAGVRSFLREHLFEQEDTATGPDGQEEPPFKPLPVDLKKELLTRWRAAREDAMKLWAEELAQDASLGAEGEEGGEEEAMSDPDVAVEEEKSEDSEAAADAAIDNAEKSFG